MFNRITAQRLLATGRWCVLCPSPALYECCTAQDMDMWGKLVDPYSKQAEGCGLILCDDCALCLGELGDLEHVIDAIQGDEAREICFLGARADMEFLKRNSLLERNVIDL